MTQPAARLRARDIPIRVMALARIHKVLLNVPLALMLAIAGVTATPPSASAATAVERVDQCNNGPVGGTIDCRATITNTIMGTSAGSPQSYNPTGTSGQTTLFQACSLVGDCVVTHDPGPLQGQPVTTVNQCNGYAVNWASLTCSVTITNNVTGVQGAPSGSSITECTNTAGWGGAVICSANVASGTATNTVSQCNPTAGAGAAMTCTTTITTPIGVLNVSIPPTTVDQCNNSTAPGTGTVTCTVTITTNFTAVAATATATATSIPAAATDVPGAPNNGYRAPDYHHELTPATGGAAAAATATPVTTAASPALSPTSTGGGISPGLAAVLQKVPESTVVAVELAAAPTPAAKTPATLPHLGGGYEDLRQRSVALAMASVVGLFAIGLWLRKRRKS